MTNEITSKIISCLRPYFKGHDKDTSLIELLSSTTQEQREHIARCWLKPEKQTVFFRVCVSEPIAVVEYLLQNCKANINDRCYYYDQDIDKSESVHEAFPLWYAARKGKVELTKLLIEHGADVNARTRRGLTAMYTACLENDFEIVKVLRAAGADVNSADNEGTTCLMATSSEDIINYLINEGANVNARQTAEKKATALHDATDYKAKALVEAGADMSILDKNGHPPFLTAALNTRGNMMEYLLEQNQESSFTIFKARVLLAVTNIMDGGENGLQMLRAAYEQKPAEHTCEHPEQMGCIANFFPDIRVPQTSNDLINISNDGNTLRSVALLIASQYISVECEFFIFALLKHATYIMNQDRKNSLAICSFVYKGILKRKEWFQDYVEVCVILYVGVLGKICFEERPVPSDMQSEFDTFMNNLTNHVIVASGELKILAGGDYKADKIMTTLLIALPYMVNICIKCHLNDVNLTSDLRRLARVNPRDIDGQSLLHIPVDKYTLPHKDKIGLQAFNPMFDLDVVSLLVQMGFPLDTQDNDGTTPLTWLLLRYWTVGMSDTQHADAIRKSPIIARFLLDKGAHPDIRSDWPSEDHIALEEFNIPPVKFFTLKCLAANAIVEQNVPYRGEMLPPDVKSFVELHEPYGQYQTDILHASLDSM